MKISAASLDVSFARTDSEISAISEFAQQNIIRIVSDMLITAQETGGNVLEMIYAQFGSNQAALDFIQSLIESV